MNRLRCWWHRSLSMQLIVSMLAVLAATQTIGLCLSWDQYLDGWRSAARTELNSRAAAAARLIQAAPPSLQPDLARVNSTDFTRFWISGGEEPGLDAWVGEAFDRFHVPLRVLLDGPGAGAPVGHPPATTHLPPDADPALFLDGARWSAPGPGEAGLPLPARTLVYGEGNGAGVIVPLGDGRALNGAFYKHFVPSFWQTPLPLTFVLTAVLVSLVGVLTVRRIARPLRRLTEAAETLGRGEAARPLAECGPDDIRRTAEAFNLMQERLHRFVEDRTRMLAAIGHDLRTPLTTLRLRAELVEDADLQERMLATIDEMQAMTEVTLSLARQDTTQEATRTIDLSALVESVCEDLADLGQPVSFTPGERVTYRCRPEGLRRTIRNLVENAVRYAGRAEVRLVATRSTVEIVVEDEGPGIPLDRIEDVFAPFVRLEDSRSRETGGTGLGLSIARVIARQHGGDIVLSPRRRGLKAAVVLPA